MMRTNSRDVLPLQQDSLANCSKGNPELHDKCMLASFTLASGQVSSFGVRAISRHLWPILFVSKLIKYNNIFDKFESVPIKAIGSKFISTVIAKVAKTELYVSVVVSIHK